jgi:hypothetical protein
MYTKFENEDAPKKMEEKEEERRRSLNKASEF